MNKKPSALKNKTEISFIFTKGKKIQKFPIKILFITNKTTSNRFLFCADRSAKNAVERNRIKRMQRSVIQEIQDDIPQGYDIAIICNANFTKLEYSVRVKKIKQALLLLTYE
ncbi:MAG: ribonuclease P protein component [Leptospiraceae bacterium]|nr:ribonuclease P protein component [Leptospiraceae bacterium]MCK6380735.1 ribonuclease P protein component [Leptospiraceae bacterium]NUM40284.1 ribonuclease P protein component [Leptospiraceae bacterium]